ncbi:MAG: tetratricopeptide repeat protein [Rickettsia endosymbiont of Sceptobius lativentris]|nr:tetratricopeptide repeat protein [Rickettsia endosymbiont of Sceptobius lativentris]
MIYIKSGYYETAFAILDKSMELKPANKNKYESVVEAYNEAIELNPENFDLDYDKGVILERLGRAELSKCFIKAFNLNDDTVFDADKTLNTTQLGEEDLAVNLKQKAVLQNIYSIKANTLSISAEYDLALEAINKCIELEPKNFYSYYNKAMVLAQLGNYYLALKAIDEAIELKPLNLGLKKFREALIQALGS